MSGRGVHPRARRAFAAGHAPETGRPRRRPAPLELEVERRAEVLEAALELMSERGIAGASLRALAQKLGMQQPSLYHYFRSKEELVDRVVLYCAEKMVESVQVKELPELPLERLPAFVVERTFELWQTERHVRFTRFLFVVAIESPARRAAIESVFRERIYGPSSEALLQAFGGRGDALRIVSSLRMLTNALELTLLQERVLFGRAAPSEDTRRFAKAMADAVRRLLVLETR